MNAGSILFAFSSLICLAGALVVVLAHNPIRSAMGLLLTIGGIAGLFLRLSAQFLAAIQLLVYAGAIVVLFVFVVMLLGPNAGVTKRAAPRTLVSRLLGAVLIGAMGLLGMSLIAGAPSTEFLPVGPAFGSVRAVGGTIFTDGLVPFELATALLIVAVVGAIAVARTKPSSLKKPEAENATLRLYHGPLLARDAERPLPKSTADEKREIA